MKKNILKVNFLYVLLFSVCYLLTLPKVSAQVNLDNVSSGLSDGYSIKEMEDILNSVTVKNVKQWAIDKKYTFIEDDGSVIEVEKNSVVTFYIFYKGNDIEQLQVSSSPQKWYKAVKEFENSSYKKGEVVTKKKSDGSEYELTFYTKGSYNYATGDYGDYKTYIWKK